MDTAVVSCGSRLVHQIIILLCGDAGTENGHVAAMQRFLRRNDLNEFAGRKASYMALELRIKE